MKLTEESFTNHPIGNDICCVFSKEQIQQILENQEKLEKIKKWFNDPEIKWVEDYDFEILRKILDEENGKQ